MEILLAITFVFGVVHLLSNTKFFDVSLDYIFTALIFEKTPKFFRHLEVGLFYFSLCFQAWYWLFKK